MQNDNVIDELKREIAKLKSDLSGFMDTRTALSSKATEFEKEILLRLLALEMNVDEIFRQVTELSRKMQKLDEVYYHIFPDRLIKDAQFEEQLRALNLPSDPSASHKEP
jgi:hypothetical protein